MINERELRLHFSRIGRKMAFFSLHRQAKWAPNRKRIYTFNSIAAFLDSFSIDISFMGLDVSFFFIVIIIISPSSSSACYLSFFFVFFFSLEQLESNDFSNLNPHALCFKSEYHFLSDKNLFPIELNKRTEFLCLSGCCCCVFSLTNCAFLGIFYCGFFL